MVYKSSKRFAAVSSLNGLTGDITLVSPDDSIDIAVVGQDIELETMNSPTSLTPYVVGPTAPYSTIYAAIQAALADGASATNIKTIAFQPAVYSESAHGNIINTYSGINFTYLDQLYNGQVFDAANNGAKFNFSGPVEIQATFIFNRTSGHCYCNMSNLFINPPTSSNIFESPAGLVLNNVLVALNSGCAAFHTTAATLGANGRSDASLNSSWIIPPSGSDGRLFSMGSTIVRNTLRLTFTDSAVWGISSGLIGTGTDTFDCNILEIFWETSKFNSQIQALDNYGILNLTGNGGSISEGLAPKDPMLQGALISGVYRGAVFIQHVRNYGTVTVSNLIAGNSLTFSLYDTDNVYDTTIFDIATEWPAQFRCANVRTQIGTFQTGAQDQPFNSLTISNEEYLAIGTNTPTVITAIDLATTYNRTPKISGTISGSNGIDIFAANYLLGAVNDSGTIVPTDNIIKNITATSGAAAADITFVPNDLDGTLDITITSIDGSTYEWVNTYQYTVN